MLKLLSPVLPVERLPEGKIDSEYKKLSLQVFLGNFIGNAAYHSIQNFSIGIPGTLLCGYISDKVFKEHEGCLYARCINRSPCILV